jgi:hypothetical protein
MSADYGVSFFDEYPDSPATTAYLDIIDRAFHHIFWILSATVVYRDHRGSRAIEQPAISGIS